MRGGVGRGRGEGGRPRRGALPSHPICGPPTFSPSLQRGRDRGHPSLSLFLASPLTTSPALPSLPPHHNTPSVTWFSNRPLRHTGVLDTRLWTATKASVAREAAAAKAAAASAAAAAAAGTTPPPSPTPGPAANLTAEAARAAAAAPFGEVWASQPPNAVAVGAWGPDAKPRVVVVVLTDPAFDAKATTLTFAIEVLANHTAWPADEAPSARGPDNTADADALEVAAASGGMGARGAGGVPGAAATPAGGAAADAAAAAERRRAAGGGGGGASSSPPPLVELGPDGEVRTRQGAVARDAAGRRIPVGALRVAAAAAAAAAAAPPQDAPPIRRRPIDLAEYSPVERAERAARAAAPAAMMELAGPATLFIDNWGVGMMGPGWGPGSGAGGCILPPGCLSVGVCGICPRGGWGGGLLGRRMV